MALENISLLLLLLLGHFLCDFLLQSNECVKDKNNKHWRSAYLYSHGLTHTVIPLLALLLYMEPSLKLVMFAGIIGVSHLFIDLVKSYDKSGKLKWFILDQLAHIAVIIIVWIMALNIQGMMELSIENVLNPKALLYALSYYIVIWPMGIMIGLTVQKWLNDISSHESLKGAGMRIGQLERLLILTFVLANHFAAIGFLLAAKSVLRFGDSKEPEHRKINEYILLGTMTSFAVTILFGLAVKEFMKLL